MVQGGYNVALNRATRSSAISWTRSKAANGCRIRSWPGPWSPPRSSACANSRTRSAVSSIAISDGTLHGKAFAGQTFDRTVHKGDLTGIEIINRLMEQVWARPIKRLEEHRAMALIPAPDGTLSGVLLINVRTGEFRFIARKAVLLATGGGPTMYRYHTPSGDKSMDGLPWRCASACSFATWRWCSSIRPACSPARTRA